MRGRASLMKARTTSSATLSSVGCGERIHGRAAPKGSAIGIDGDPLASCAIVHRAAYGGLKVVTRPRVQPNKAFVRAVKQNGVGGSHIALLRFSGSADTS